MPNSIEELIEIAEAYFGKNEIYIGLSSILPLLKELQQLRELHKDERFGARY